jgi:hypothetical protein
MVWDWMNTTYAALVAAVITTTGFLVRKILTNEAKVAVLESKLKVVENLEEDIRELRGEIKDLIYHMTGTNN